MKTGMLLAALLLLLLLLLLCTGVCEGAGYPTFTAVAKHPMGGGRFMLVVPGYKGLPVFVDAEDRLMPPAAEILAAPVNWVRLSDGRVIFSPQPLPSPYRINPQPAYIVVPKGLRSGFDGPPSLGP